MRKQSQENPAPKDLAEAIRAKLQARNADTDAAQGDQPPTNGPRPGRGKGGVRGGRGADNHQRQYAFRRS